MNLFLLNLLLALGWTLINGQYATSDFIIGFVIGFFSISVTQPFYGKGSYGRKFYAAIELFVVFLYHLLTSSLQVVWDVITPQHLSDPAIIEVPIELESDLQIMLLANIVSLTPGSLSLNVSDDKKHLIIHAMFGSNPDAVIHGIKQTFERRILEVVRD